MSKTAHIEVRLSDDGTVSVWLDGRCTHDDTITSEDEFVEFLTTATEDYWWWIGEAWRTDLDEIENIGWQEDDE